MSLVQHAKAELQRAGTFDEDPEFAQSIVNAVAAFASYGHSGGSASVGIPMLNDLLQFKALTPITDDPEEWMDVAEYSGYAIWQSRRQSSLFSEDGGKTYYNIDDKHPWWRRVILGKLLRMKRWDWAKHYRSVPVNG